MSFLIFDQGLLGQIISNILSLLLGIAGTYYYFQPKDKNGVMDFGPSHWNEEEKKRIADFRAAGAEERDVRNQFRPHNWLLCTSSRPERRVRYKYFWFPDEKRYRVLVKFGKDTEGIREIVHGGCSATVADIGTGVLTHKVAEGRVMTANLTVNYRAPIPTDSTVVMECWPDRMEGRKIWCKYEFKSLNGKTQYVNGTALYITLRNKQAGAGKSGAQSSHR